MSEEERKAIELLETYKNKLVYEISNKDKRAVETVLNLIEKQEKEISNKDKIIDLMANHIATSDSDLCEYLDITTKCKYYAGDNGKTCDNCIKQYFENKAKER